MSWIEIMDPWKFVYDSESDGSTNLFDVLCKLVPKEEARELVGA